MSSFRTACHQGLRPLALPESAGVHAVAVDINWADAGAGISVNDVIQIADIPPGIEVVDWKFITDDIDSNGTPTVAFTLGTLNAARTAIDVAWTAAGGINAGQTGGSNSPSGATAAAAMLQSRSAQRTVGLVATAAAATASLSSAGVSRRATLLLWLRAGNN